VAQQTAGDHGENWLIKKSASRKAGELHVTTQGQRAGWWIPELEQADDGAGSTSNRPMLVTRFENLTAQQPAGTRWRITTKAADQQHTHRLN